MRTPLKSEDECASTTITPTPDLSLQPVSYGPADPDDPAAAGGRPWAAVGMDPLPSLRRRLGEIQLAAAGYDEDYGAGGGIGGGGGGWPRATVLGPLTVHAADQTRLAITAGRPATAAAAYRPAAAAADLPGRPKTAAALGRPVLAAGRSQPARPALGRSSMARAQSRSASPAAGAASAASAAHL